MKNMTLKEISVACGGLYYGDELSYYKKVEGVAIDSRKVEKDYLFVAIRGTRVDGHMFIPQSIQDGALCALSEKRIEGASYPYIMVNSCTKALRDIAEHYRLSLKLTVVGISGSVGKTSTKEMISSVLGQSFHVLKTEGNYNNEIGLPLTIFNIKEEHQVAVLEMGISDFGEMEILTKIARPDLCVLTNIGCAHLEQLKSREGILKAKTEMFLYMNPHGHIILNGDDDMLFNVHPANGIEPILFGLKQNLSYGVEDIKDLGLDGSLVTFLTPTSRFEAHISIPGVHMVYNSLAAIAIGHILGMNDTQIKDGIEALPPLMGRGGLLKTETLTIIDDCYNANPVSMCASLDVLRKASGRTVAILGDMFELGAKEQALHREVGLYAARSGINLLICIGLCSIYMSQGASSESSNIHVYHYATKVKFLENMDALIQPGDTILVKASHGMEFPEIVKLLKMK